MTGFDPDARNPETEKLRQQTEALQEALLSSTPMPEEKLGLQVDNTWTKQTAKALDLTDAIDPGMQDPFLDSMVDIQKVAQALAHYKTTLHEFLLMTQGILVEGVSQLEEMQHYYYRLR